MNKTENRTFEFEGDQYEIRHDFDGSMHQVAVFLSGSRLEDITYRICQATNIEFSKKYGSGIEMLMKFAESDVRNDAVRLRSKNPG